MPEDKNALSVVTVAMLRAIQRFIQEKPQHFRMGFWYLDPKQFSMKGDHCTVNLAGAAVVIKDYAGNVEAMVQANWGIKKEHSIPSVAGRILQLDEDQQDLLFYYKFWPTVFQRDLLLPGTTAYVNNTVSRINYFIDTKGKEPLKIWKK